jgi:primosomal protein N'
MIAECQNEQTMLMWSTANELLTIANNNDDKTRLEEFKRRFSEARHQQVPLSSMNNSKKNRNRTSIQKTTSQQVIYDLH